ncbi:MAG: PAS domain S-box protein [Negativicutes bacterium]|nr:PAS domain S-box protein [Negativicutes bacterium]
MNANISRHQLTIKQTTIVIFITIMGISTIGIGYFVFSNWRSSSDEMMNQMAANLNSKIESQIEEFIRTPLQINEVQHLLFENEIVDLNNAVEREKYFAGVLKAYEQAVYSLSYGTQTGEYYGARRNAAGAIEIMRNNAATGGHTWYYSLNEDMSTGDIILQTATAFDPRTRDWYRAADTAKSGTFSPIYQHFVMNDLTVSAAYPIYQPTGELAGVLGAHVILSGIETFLRETVSQSQGLAVIVEKDSEYLVSNSLNLANFSFAEDGVLERVKIDQLGNRALASAYRQYLSTGTANYRYIDNEFDLFFSAVEVQNQGINWVVLSAIPQSYLETGWRDNVRLALGAFFLAVIAVILLYLFYLQKAFQPLTALVKATKDYGEGNFSPRVPVRQADEIGNLAQAFNIMADKTESIMNHLEDLVEERTSKLENARRTLAELNQKLIAETEIKEKSERLLNLFFTQSLTGSFFMMLDQPVEWNDSIDKEETLAYIFDHQRDTKVNPALLQQYGLSAAELMSRTPRDSFADQLKQGFSFWRQMLDAGYLHAITEEKRADGSRMIIEGDYIVMYDETGKVIGHFGNQQDITDRVQLQQQLQESEQKYRLLYSSMSQGLALHEIITDANGKPVDYVFLDLNDSYTSLLGVTRENAIGKRITEVMPQVELYWIEMLGKVALSGEAMYYENYLETTKRYYATYSYAIRPRQFAVLVSDITDRKKAEQALLQSHRLLDYIINHSNGGVSVFDRELNYLFVSERYLEEYGISGQNIIGKNHYEVFPDLPQKWRDVHQMALQGIVSKADDDSYIHQDGSVDWTRWECRPWYDENQQIGGIIVYTEVINQRKQLELQLLQERETLSATLHSIGDGVIATDAEGRITSLNGVAERLTGWQEEEAQGKPFAEVFQIVSDPNNLPCENPIEKVFLSGEVVELANHTILLARDGSRYFIEDSASPIHQDNGEIIGAVLVFRDVTEKKQKQREIEYLGNHDYLTGLYNRRYFVEAFDTFVRTAQYPLGVMMLDVNGLKIINDAYGHTAGDLALTAVTKILSETFQACDVIARIGGDEFAILLPHTSLQTMDVYKDAIRRSMAENLIMNVPLSVAIGYESKEGRLQSLDEMLKSAENHMYRQKFTEGISVRNHAIQAILQTLTDKYQLEKNHSERVRYYARQIGEAMNLPADQLKELEMAGMYHDIGKMSIPDAILQKPGKLSAEEYDLIKNHTQVGYQILRAADEYSDLAIHALQHHEHWDGKGYPSGLKGNQILLISRIISVADAFEAMTAERPYKKSMTLEEAKTELLRVAGTQFDPDIVKIFIDQVLQRQPAG